MTELNFTIGLTDQIDYEGFVYSNDDSLTSKVYNIQRPTMDIEKDSIKWKLNIDLPATLNIVAMWETIIRRPHLNMINIQKIPTELLQNYDSYVLNIDYINLIPINPALTQTLCPQDYNALTEDLDFGDLYLNEFNLYPGTDWSCSLSSAYYSDDISKLQIRETSPVISTKFSANFHLRNYSVAPQSGNTPRFLKWVEDNKEQLIANGYIPGTNSCKIGRLVIGKLIGDPWVEYQKLQTYPAICRTSITKVE